MRAALDGTPLTAPTGGVRRYTEELHRALRERYGDEHEFSLLSDQLERPKSWLKRRWWAYGLPHELRHRHMDVFHGTDFSVPYWPACASVMTLHDLSPWKERRWQADAARVRRRTPWQICSGLASIVITPSEAIRREAIGLFGLAPGDIHAVPLAAAAHLRPSAPFAWPRPYFLYVGTLEPRKNIPFLVECWRAAQVPADLLLCGRQRADFATLPSQPGLHVLGAVPEQRLPQLYSGALAVAYPSLYEGFGLPVLEAMQCGAAVITSQDPAVREAGGDAALALAATDAHAWTEALRAICRNPDLVAELRRKSVVRAAEFSWRRTAEETFAIYREAMDRCGG